MLKHKQNKLQYCQKISPLKKKKNCQNKHLKPTGNRGRN